MFIETFANAINANSLLFNSLSFLVGLLAGHRMNVLMAQRQALIAASLPIRKWVLEELNQPRITTNAPSEFELNELTRRLNWLSRKRFIAAYEAQQEARNTARSQPDKFGHSIFLETATINEHLKNCLRYLNAK